jgi:hypothetical protein
MTTNILFEVFNFDLPTLVGVFSDNFPIQESGVYHIQDRFEIPGMTQDESVLEDVAVTLNGVSVHSSHFLDFLYGARECGILPPKTGNTTYE